MDKTKLLQEAKTILQELKRCGNFYPSAIELDLYGISNAIDGEDFEEKIDELLKKLKTI